MDIIRLVNTYRKNKNIALPTFENQEFWDFLHKAFLKHMYRFGWLL
jgi:hypothetical protein